MKQTGDKGSRLVTEQSHIGKTGKPIEGLTPVGQLEPVYDMRRLSYAGTFKNPFKAGTIRVIEWATAKFTLLRMIRRFERAGAPFGAPFWPKAIKHMGIDIQTPDAEIRNIPATGPVIVVSNHPHGLVDGMIIAEMFSGER